ncbi:putative ADP-ribosylation factor-binding protein [Naja naja]|nr:putative ADP-ribosylation factor-binding protein [Naja naja]
MSFSMMFCQKLPFYLLGNGPLHGFLLYGSGLPEPEGGSNTEPLNWSGRGGGGATKREPMEPEMEAETLESRINRATNPLNKDVEWDNINAFCDQLNKELEGC